MLDPHNTLHVSPSQPSRFNATAQAGSNIQVRLTTDSPLVHIGTGSLALL
jgi:hypothetical protein